jgi:hypothetical protein
MVTFSRSAYEVAYIGRCRRNPPYFGKTFLRLIYIDNNQAYPHLKLGRYGDNEARKIRVFCGNTSCTCNMVLRITRRSVLEPTVKPSHTEESALRKVVETLRLIFMKQVQVCLCLKNVFKPLRC